MTEYNIGLAIVPEQNRGLDYPDWINDTLVSFAIIRSATTNDPLLRVLERGCPGVAVSVYE